jgi:ketosteroid isomerase-like protein
MRSVTDKLTRLKTGDFDMKKSIGIATLTGIFLMLAAILPNRVKAQEWSAAQKEVWKVENDIWASLAKGDASAFLEFFHPDYMGWDDNDPLPSTKTELQKWIQLYTMGRKIISYEIKPVGIRVFGDFAIVDYYYSMFSDVDGKKKMENGRWTDVLIKQGTKWFLAGDNGGENVKNHED